MRITLISLHPEVLSIGIRMLSGCLKQNGYDVRLIFLPVDDYSRHAEQRYLGDFSTVILDNLVYLCRDADLIGISLLTNYFFRAVTVTKALQAKLDIPIVWGGPHPTAQPEQCLQYADMVCLGEGEEAVVDLVKRVSTGQRYDEIPNIWLRQGNKIQRNDPRPLIQNLDSLPMPDCDLLGQYILENEKIRTLNADLLLQHAIFRSADEQGLTYPVLSSRGCPHNCSYCANDMWRRMYAGQRYVRRRSVEAICDEIDHASERIPGITSINFADDNFAARSIKSMKSFLETYMLRVKLPFSCTLSPMFAESERLDMLTRAGVFRISVGIQSASKRILEIYDRRVSVEAAKSAVEKLERIRPNMRKPRIANYHFIVDNPYETAEDQIATLRFILRLPRRKSALCFSLVPFPGTAIYEMMRRDGLIYDESTQIFTKDFWDHQRNFTKYWLYLFFGGVPAPVLRALLRPALVRIVNLGRPKWLFRIIYLTLEQGYRFIGQVKQVLKRPIKAASQH